MPPVVLTLAPVLCSPGALRNLAACDAEPPSAQSISIRRVIASSARCVPLLVKLLCSGDTTHNLQENAAAVLGFLAETNSPVATKAAKADIIPRLVELLGLPPDPSHPGLLEQVACCFGHVVANANLSDAAAAVAAGAVPLLANHLGGQQLPDVQQQLVASLRVSSQALAGRPWGKAAMAGAILPLIALLEPGIPLAVQGEAVRSLRALTDGCRVNAGIVLESEGGVAALEALLGPEVITADGVQGHAQAVLRQLEAHKSNGLGSAHGTQPMKQEV